jgi:PBP1b-binding outer membrane lipoprotein LpoB
MKKIILLLWILLLLTSCNSNTKVLETDNDYFDKKKECALLYDTVYSSLEDKYWKITNWVDKTWYYQIEIPKIFYSPILNSCISYTEVIDRIKSEKTNWIYHFEITNILTKEIIDWITCHMNTSWEKINWNPQFTSEDMNNFSNCSKIINDKLEELKN